MSSRDARSVGVEEEFLLVRGRRPELSAQGEQVVGRADETDSPGQFAHEFKSAQTELGSPPRHRLSELQAELQRLRSQLASAARSEGTRLIASASSPLADRPSTTDDERYRRMNEQFGLLAREQLTCGMHVHVSIDSPAEGVAVIDRIRPWLAVLIALSSNSPLFGRRDTGYASYRTVLWGQWPTAGPTGPFGDEASYRSLVRELVGIGAARDEGMIYFDARLSGRYPTVEVRVCDVCPRVQDAVVIAALCRALVETAARQAGNNVSTPRPELLRGAAWRAARFGMSGELADLSGREPVLRPPWDAVDALLDHVGAALDRFGDRGAVTEGLHRIRERGTGAQLQRAAFAEGGVRAALEAVTV